MKINHQKAYLVLSVFLGFLLFVLLFVPGEAMAGNYLREVRYSSEVDNFRLVFEFEQEPEYDLFFLASPPRIVIHLEETELDQVAEEWNFNEYSVEKLRFGRWGDSLRVVIDLTNNYTGYESYLFSDPHRLVIDVRRQLELESDFKVRITRGLEYSQIRQRGMIGPLLVNVLKAELGPNTGLMLQPVLAQERITGGEKVTTMSARYQALAAVNGTYFDGRYSPLGLMVIDSMLVSEPINQRTALGLTAEGNILMDRVDVSIELATGSSLVEVDGVNRPPGQDEIVLYNHKYALQTSGQAEIEYYIEDDIITDFSTDTGGIIPWNGYVLAARGTGVKSLREELEPGEAVSLRFNYSPDHWNQEEVVYALGGGPRLVSDGQIQVTGLEEKFRSDITDGYAPRTGLGITADGEVLIATVSGRSDYSKGVTLEELAQLMIRLGAVEAMNLDGGGSTTMVLQDRIYNLPSEGEESKVSNALLILTDR